MRPPPASAALAVASDNANHRYANLRISIGDTRPSAAANGDDESGSFCKGCSCQWFSVSALHFSIYGGYAPTRITRE